MLGKEPSLIQEVIYEIVKKEKREISYIIENNIIITIIKTTGSLEDSDDSFMSNS